VAAIWLRKRRGHRRAHFGRSNVPDRVVEPGRDVSPLRGVAYGARVSGTFFAVLTFVALSGPLVSYGFSLPMTPFIAYGMFVAIRPWFMGATISEMTLEIRSWYRSYRIDITKIQSVGLSPYNARGELRFLPFVGQVRILTLVMESGSPKNYPATLGRRRRVQRIATEIVSYARSAGSDVQLADSYYD
jgi:hypothetical protein